MKKVAVAIPIYKRNPDVDEMFSLEQCKKHLERYDVIFVAPKSLDISRYLCYFPTSHVVRFSDSYFKDLNGYNRLMMSVVFYDSFEEYEFILVYQLDALVFKDELEYFCELGYDYIGAPWNRLIGTYVLEEKIYTADVGNGGFSLRRVSAFQRVLVDEKERLDGWQLNEDVLFAHIGQLTPGLFRIAPVEVAARFSIESNIEVFRKINGGEVPFGCHKWNLFCGDYYRDVFSQLKITPPEGFEYRCEDKFFYDYYLYRTALRKLDDLNSNLAMREVKQVSLYGFGHEGKHIYDKLLARGIVVTTIYDQNKHGELVDGITIETPRRMDRANGLILVSSEKFEDEICKELQKKGFARKEEYITIADLMLTDEEKQLLTDKWWFIP